MVPVQGVTCPAEVSESDAIGCNVRSKPVAAPECCVCEGADRADVSGAKTATVPFSAVGLTSLHPP